MKRMRLIEEHCIHCQDFLFEETVQHLGNMLVKATLEESLRAILILCIQYRERTGMKVKSFHLKIVFSNIVPLKGDN